MATDNKPKLVAIIEKGTAYFKCNAHKSTVSGTGAQYVTGSPNVIVEGRPAVRLNDSHRNGCGHTFKAIQGSKTVLVNNRPVHRLQDKIAGSGTGQCVIPGNKTVFAGG